MKAVGRKIISTAGPARKAVSNFVTAIVAGLILQSFASGGFIGDYSPGKFTLTNSNADGWFEVISGGSELHLFGGNSGTGLTGTTDLTVTAALGGLFSFTYSYTSLDWPGFDRAGYLVNGLFTFLADTGGQTGEVKLPLAAGDIFGFRVATDDNLGEPGLLAITQFSAPGGLPATVPEASTVWLIAGGGVLLALRKRSI
ncbi:MAG: hypothetical protein IT161_23895 [Bryobacterales bacterium]|nr:hypothetical protein [Bryobacterales bacterium]